MNSKLAFFLTGLSLASLGCGSDESPSPPCTQIQGDTPKTLFTHPVIAVEDVREALIFGEMSAGELTPINFEIGFRLDEINIPISSPADIQIRFIESTTFTSGWREGERDFSIGFEVCSEDGEAAVVGQFAHVTDISAELKEKFESGDSRCQDNNQVESNTSCTVQFDDLKLAAGTAIGSVGGTGQSEYRPGFDFNLYDTRYPNTYINPDRIGSEEGPGKWFRYGACLYEYFAPPIRQQYLDLVALNGDRRESQSSPCGTLSIGQANTAAGIWILEDKANLSVDDDWMGVFGNLLVLGPHFVKADSLEALSTDIAALSEIDGEQWVMEFAPDGADGINPSVYQMQMDRMYCINARPGFDVEGEANYYISLEETGELLRVERLTGPCAPEASRSFSSAALRFVR